MATTTQRPPESILETIDDLRTAKRDVDLRIHLCTDDKGTYHVDIKVTIGTYYPGSRSDDDDHHYIEASNLTLGYAVIAAYGDACKQLLEIERSRPHRWGSYPEQVQAALLTRFRAGINHARQHLAEWKNSHVTQGLF